jgi:hypothetical protein
LETILRGLKKIVAVATIVVRATDKTLKILVSCATSKTRKNPPVAQTTEKWVKSMFNMLYSQLKRG